MTHPSSSAARTPRSLFRVAALAAAAIVAALSGWHTSASTPQQVGTWASFGTVADSRSGAAAVALPDGRTLILGGVGSDETTTDSVVVLDPASRSVAQAGRMLEARAGHTATLLKDGRVLIAGGIVNGLVSADIELFDPVAGTSVLAGSMAQPRTRHAAALVGDDKVLIAGGVTADGVFLDQAEIADGATGGSIPAGSPMLTARAGASATTLIEGHVLIAGGENSSGALRSAEVFEPWSGSFIAADTELSVARSGHSALLLPHNGGVLISGGTSAGVAVAASDLFLPAVFPDPYSFGMGAFVPTGDLTVARTGAISGPAGDDGHAFVAGGGTTEAEQYSYATIKTDKDDYAPGEQALITGSGWQPGEVVTLKFQEDPAVHDDYVLSVTADANGNIYWSEWSPEHHDLNVRFYLMASGSRSRAQMTFTDAGAFTVAVTPNSVAGGSTNDFVFAFQATNSGGSSPIQMTIPAGWTAPRTGNGAGQVVVTNGTCTPGAVSVLGNVVTIPQSCNNNQTFSITYRNATAPAAPATYTFLTTLAAVSPTVTVVSAGPTKLAFTSAPVTGAVGQCLGAISIQTQNASSTPTNVTSATTVNLSTDAGAGGGFFSNGTCTTAITSISIAAGSNSASFFYKASVRGTGSHVVTASASGLTPASQTETINKANQTISFGALAGKTFGDPDFGVSATATSGLIVSFAASGSCTVSGSTVHLTGAGSCTITASQAGDGNFNAATDVPQSFAIGKAASTTTVTVANATYDGNPHGGTASVTGFGGLNQTLTVNYQGRNGTVYPLSATAPTNAGDYTASASFAGDTDHQPSNDSKNYSINKANQTISFGALAGKTFGDPDFGVSATASSGLTVSFAASGTCTVTGGTVHLTGAGSCTITASQAGDGNFNAATDVPQTFAIGKAASTTTVTVANATYDGNPHGGTASATGFGGLNQTLTVNYEGRNGTVYPLSATAPTNAGDYTASASFAGDTDHQASNDSKNYSIAKANQTISFGVLAAKTFGDPDFGVSATATSGLAVSFAASGNCTVAGSTVHLTGAGSCTITASQAGDGNFNAATDVPQTFAIGKAASTTTVTVANATYDGNPHGGTASVTGFGGLSQTLTVSYEGRNGTVYPLSTIAPTNAGDYTASASFGGDTDHHASSDSQDYSIAKANQTISFGALAAKTFGDPDFGVSATATSGLAVSFAASGNCTVAGSTVHLTGAGSCTITASQAGNGNFNAATDVPQSFAIGKAASTTTVTVANATYDGNPHGGTASVSGFGGLSQTLTVSYEGRNGTAYPLSTIAPTNAGDYTASASFAGDTDHHASNDSQDYSIAKANQTISFGVLAAKTFGDPDFGVSATATSGLAVSFAASGNCTVTGATVHLTGAGTCTITASQAGDGNFNAATDVPQSFAIGKAASTTTVTVANATYDGNPHGGTASVTGFGGLSQTLTVSYEGRNGTVYPLSTIAPTNAGDYTASASFAGDTDHDASNDSQPYSIAKADQTITFGALPGKTFGDPDFGVSATATSGLAVSFAASGNCTVSGSTVNLTGAGSCTITASQTGDGNFNAAAVVPQTFAIGKAASTTTVTVANATYDGNPHGGTASATGAGGLNQSLTVSYEGRNGTVYPLSTTAPTNAGDYTASASFGGDTNHHASNDSKDYSIGKANQTIAFGALAGRTFGDADFGVSATATSGLAVSFAATGNCTITGATVHLTGAGSCTITASQTGNANYNAAPDVPQSFAIAKAASTTTVTVANATYDGNPHGGTAGVTGFAGLSQTLTVSYEGRNGTVYPLSTTAPTNAGDYTASASFGGDADHHPSADHKDYTIAKANQTIAFGPLGTKLFGDPDFSVGATASSGLPVSFAAAGHCTVSGNTVHLTGSGNCTITASQPGNGNYSSAPDVPRTLAITAWTLSGFYQPVDPTTTSTVVWNTVKGGSTVPLKFNIYAGSVEQTAVSAVKLMTATQVSCSASSSVEAVITELVSTGGTSLRYDGTGHQFIQNWQTPRAAGVCYRVTMTALDGSTIDNAFFKIK